MRVRISLCVSFLVLLSVCFTSCKKKELKDFTFSYSMECVSNYWVSVSFDSERNFRMERRNYYVDNFARKRNPKIMEGKMNDEEFASLIEVLQDCDLYKMEDSYGFEKEVREDVGDIMYQISFSSEGREKKFISIRSDPDIRFPSSFIKLIGFINSFVSDHRNDENVAEQS